MAALRRRLSDRRVGGAGVVTRVLFVAAGVGEDIRATLGKPGRELQQFLVSWLS